MDWNMFLCVCNLSYLQTWLFKLFGINSAVETDFGNGSFGSKQFGPRGSSFPLGAPIFQKTAPFKNKVSALGWMEIVHVSNDM